jgi:CheY-like chemotaxis protein
MSATLGIVRSHEGALQLTSTPDAGTTFRMLLPLPDSAETADLKPAGGQPPGLRRNGTVLLVDDEEELRVVGPVWLDKCGFAAITAANGREALTIYREQTDKIDLILLDLLMPEMNGSETYRRIRAVSRTIPIIFCSGCSRKELSADILEDEHAGFLKKPYNPDQLRGVLLERLEPLNTASEVGNAS